MEKEYCPFRTNANGGTFSAGEGDVKRLFSAVIETHIYVLSYGRFSFSEIDMPGFTINLLGFTASHKAKFST